MNSGALLFFSLGATVLWGGLVTTLIIAIKKEKELG